VFLVMKEFRRILIKALEKPKREIPFGEGCRMGKVKKEKLIDLLDGHLSHITCVLLLLLYQYRLYTPAQ